MSCDRAAPAPSLEAARRVADAVLYEGYLLYPYRSSAQKNRLRWQFGVLAPRRWSEAGGGDGWRSRTETLVEADEAATFHLRLRFLHLETRGEGGGAEWDEGTEREVHAVVGTAGLARGEALRFAFPDTPARPGYRREAVEGCMRVSACPLPGPYGALRLRVDVENATGWYRPGAGREEAVRRSLVATHLLIAVSGGRFLSLADPPEWARSAAEECVNEGTWPALIGDAAQVVLSSPIILPDHAEVAPESPGDLFDATEIDEILGLRILALTDEEKSQARRTDPRAAAIVDRLETMPPEVWQRLHGAVRSLRPAAAGPDTPGTGNPWWDPGAERSVSPGTDSVSVGGVMVAGGSRVRLTPGRADAQDMFLAGRTAVVQAVLNDVDGGWHLAVSLEDDPTADLMSAHGRYLYFHPDEVEPL